jgi:hypothetical protein
VAHGDRAAVNVDPVVGDTEVPLVLQHDRGKGLVQLEQVDVVDRQCGLGEKLAGGRRRAGQHDRRVTARDGGPGDAGSRAQTEFLADLLAAEQDERGAVYDAGGVTRRVDVIDLVEPVILLDGHRVEAKFT